MPPEAEEQAQRELKRLERMPDAAAEYSMIRTYLDWLLAMPWSKVDPETVDIEQARAILDEDHYRPREGQAAHPRISGRAQTQSGGHVVPILCFVGPPGVGKTSLGQSIAKAHGTQVRARQPGRRARRGRDSRSSPHLHRRAARPIMQACARPARAIPC